jgi:hypothetical protein
MNEAEELKVWRAEREISRVILRYARGVDARDFDRVRGCFHADARIHYGDWFSGDLEAGMAFLEDSIPRLQSTLHVFGTPWIDLDPAGEYAECETYAINSATYFPDANGEVIQNVSGTKYLDRFSIRDGRWAIDERRNRRVWAHNLPEGGEPALPGDSMSIDSADGHLRRDGPE